MVIFHGYVCQPNRWNVARSRSDLFQRWLGRRHRPLKCHSRHLGVLGPPSFETCSEQLGGARHDKLVNDLAELITCPYGLEHNTRSAYVQWDRRSCFSLESRQQVQGWSLFRILNYPRLYLQLCPSIPTNP